MQPQDFTLCDVYSGKIFYHRQTFRVIFSAYASIGFVKFSAGFAENGVYIFVT